MFQESEISFTSLFTDKSVFVDNMMEVHIPLKPQQAYTTETSIAPSQTITQQMHPHACYQKYLSNYSYKKIDQTHSTTSMA